MNPAALLNKEEKESLVDLVLENRESLPEKIRSAAETLSALAAKRQTEADAVAAKGLEDGALDGAIYDATDEDASRLNNMGTQHQAAYLIQQGMTAEQILLEVETNA